METYQVSRRAFLGTTAGAAAMLVSGPPAVATGSDYYVTDDAELRAAIKRARPGETIVMQDGVWNDLSILIGDFANNGVDGAPITIQAETRGRVTLSGISHLAIGRDYWIVDGLVFENGHWINDSDEFPQTWDAAVIDFSAGWLTNPPYGTGVVANHSEIRHITIKDYNPPDNSIQYFYVRMPGQHNRVSYCHFSGKTNTLQILSGARPNGEPPYPNAAPPSYHRVDHNYFADIPCGQRFGPIRTDTAHSWPSPDHMVIEHNLFRHCNGEWEMIEIKSSEIIIRHNTTVESEGHFALHHGNKSEIYGNYWFGKNIAGCAPSAVNGSGPGGIQVAGEDHRIYNNYIDGCGTRPAIWIMSAWPTNSIPYHGSRNVEIVNNTIVNSVGTSIEHGFESEHLGEQPNLGPTPPLDITLANNIVWSTSGILIKHGTPGRPPIGTVYEGNIMYGSQIDIDPVPSGIKETDPLMEAVEVNGYTVYKPSAESPATDGASGSYPYVSRDIEGKRRPRPRKDVGSHELSRGRLLYPPLNGGDVGPSYLRNSDA